RDHLIANLVEVALLESSQSNIAHFQGRAGGYLVFDVERPLVDVGLPEVRLLLDGEERLTQRYGAAASKHILDGRGRPHIGYKEAVLDCSVERVVKLVIEAVKLGKGKKQPIPGAHHQTIR